MFFISVQLFSRKGVHPVSTVRSRTSNRNIEPTLKTRHHTGIRKQMKTVFLRHVSSSLEKNVTSESMSLIFTFVVGSDIFALTLVLKKNGKGNKKRGLLEEIIEVPVMVFFLHDDFFKHAPSRGVAPFECFVYDLSVQHYGVVFRGVT